MTWCQRHLRLSLTALLLSANAFAVAMAAAPASAPIVTAAPSPGGMLQVMVGLLLVLGVLVAVAWSMKKMGAGKHAGAAGAIKIVGGIGVGNRERILVVEVADQWIVVGVTATAISALSTMPKQSGYDASGILPQNFAGWLKQTIDKRSATTAPPPNQAHDAK